MDRLKGEQRRFLHRVIWGMIAIAGAHFVVLLVSGGVNDVREITGYAVFAAGMIAALRLLARGRLTIAGWIVTATLYAGLVAIGVLWDSLEPGIATAFIVLVLVTGFSMGSGAGAVAAVIATLTLATLTALRAADMLPSGIVSSTPASMAAMVALSVIQAGVLIWYGLRRLEKTLRVSGQREAETRQALADLTATREENERRASQGDALARLAEQLIKVRSPKTLRRDAVEAVSQTLGVSAAALISVDDSISTEASMGFEIGERTIPRGGPLVDLSTADGPAVIDGETAVRQSLEPLFVNVFFPKLIVAPVRTRTRRDLLVAGSSRELTTTELAFVLTVANLLGGIRERQMVEAELRQAQKMEVVGQISGSVAHDFNNLLFAILGSAELLKYTAGSGNEPMIDNIIRAGEHASMLTRQLLAFARRRPETVDVHDLREVVRDLGNLLDRLTGERVNLKTETCDEEVPVEVDRGNIEQVVFNLVANARDAIASNGEVRISVEIERGTTALLRVSDTGAGIPDDVVKRIFEPFFTTKAEGRGTGIGLATVRRIIDDASGTIDVDTAPGEGTVFVVRLPMALEQAEKRKKFETRPPGTLFPSHILLLDDNAMVREATRAMLENAGHRVEEGTNGREGLGILTDSDVFDLLLTDVIMPEMGGVELLQEIRHRNSDLPVILMTGYADPDLDLSEVTEASDILRKPIRQADLLHKVDKILEHSQRS